VKLEKSKFFHPLPEEIFHHDDGLGALKGKRTNVRVRYLAVKIQQVGGCFAPEANVIVRDGEPEFILPLDSVRCEDHMPVGVGGDAGWVSESTW